MMVCIMYSNLFKNSFVFVLSLSFLIAQAEGATAGKPKLGEVTEEGKNKRLREGAKSDVTEDESDKSAGSSVKTAKVDRTPEYILFGGKEIPAPLFLDASKLKSHFQEESDDDEPRLIPFTFSEDEDIDMFDSNSFLSMSSELTEPEIEADNSSPFTVVETDILDTLFLDDRELNWGSMDLLDDETQARTQTDPWAFLDEAIGEFMPMDWNFFHLEKEE
jgi:hypothetical protein